MTPINFEEANYQLTAPEGFETEVQTLFAHKASIPLPIPGDEPGKESEEMPIVTSCWQLDQSDWERIKENGGKIWFSCWGTTHPPMWLDTEKPGFVK